MAIKRRNKSTEFKGIDLNPHNVYGIFKMCSVPEDVSLEDTNEELIHAILYPKDFGYKKDSLLKENLLNVDKQITIL